MKTLSALAASLVVFSLAITQADELEKPFQLLAGDQPLDVGGIGYAAPFVGDFDLDGRRDLLVGQFREGKMRIFLNQGTNEAPKFGAEYVWFQDGAETGRVPTGWCIGFTPQLVDFDGDGDTDVLTGSWPGELFFFQRNDDGKFAPGEKILNDNDEAIDAGSASTVFAIDWDADDDLDLVLGDIRGNVHVVENTGTRQQYKYGEPITLELGDILKDRGGDSGPIVADWDADGKNDLIVPFGDGSVVWFRNVGTKTEAKFDKGSELVAKSGFGFDFSKFKPDMWGARVKVCAVDWNNDGHLDLLLGDRSGKTVDESDEDRAKRNKSIEARDKLLQQRKALREQIVKATDVAEKSKLQAEYNALSKEYLEVARSLGSNRPKSTRHGYVWVFLRKTSQAAQLSAKRASTN